MEVELLTSPLGLINRTCEQCGKTIMPQKIELFGIVKYIYPICKCEGDKIREREELNAREEKKRRLERLFNQSRLGERFKNCTFENYPQIPETKDIYTTLKNYAENFSNNRNKSILLLSHPGTGKTYLSSCIVNKLITKGIVSIFVVVPSLLDQIRASYDKDNSDTEAKIMSGLHECDLLVLDDLGAERHREKDDWGTEKLYSIINSRYTNMKATIFTSNCTLKELSDKLGDRTFSRIAEMTEGLRFDMNNVKDFRLKSFYKR